MVAGGSLVKTKFAKSKLLRPGRFPKRDAKARVGHCPFRKRSATGLVGASKTGQTFKQVMCVVQGTRADEIVHVRDDA